MNKSQEFLVNELGTSYMLPKFGVVDSKGIQKVIELEPGVHPTKMKDRPDAYQEITFVREDKRTVTKEEFKSIVSHTNDIAPCIGKPEFDIDMMQWKTEATNESLESGNSYYSQYYRNVEAINNYLNPIPRVDGILHEQLLGVMITDLEYKISLVPSEESNEALKNLKQALFWLNERTANRVKRQVEGTYKQ